MSVDLSPEAVERLAGAHPMDRTAMWMVEVSAILRALSTELAYMRQRERDICKAVGGVSDGGRYRNDIIEHLQIVFKKSSKHDATAATLRALSAELARERAAREAAEKAYREASLSYHDAARGLAEACTALAAYRALTEEEE